MAQKRMFNKTITNSDEFIDMPDSSQNLYFHLSMNADDDGFVNNWKSIMRMTGHKEDDLKVLIAKNYIIPFKSGVIVIKHWRINNYLRSDRYVETKYLEEKKQLYTDENSVYQLATNGIPSIDKYSIEENNIYVSEDTTHTRFKKPTLEEVQKYCEERNNQVDAERFINFYESKGWKVGNQPMKDWKACIRTWEKEKTKIIKPKWLDEDIKEQKATKEEEQEIKDLLKEFE